jgi:hypothetical protein
LLFFGTAISPSRIACLRGQVCGAASAFSRVACSSGFSVKAPPLHFAEHAFPLHFLLQNAKS